MGLESLLAMLKSGVTEVTEVQANNGGASGCNPAQPEGVTEVTPPGGGNPSVTPVTPRNPAEVTEQASNSKACTPVTPDTPEIIMPQRATATAPLPADAEAEIRAWLAMIGETDPATIHEVLGEYHRYQDARDYYGGRAGADLPKPDPYPDDRRTCSECTNLAGRRCRAAMRRELIGMASWHEPDPERLHACYAFLPLANDPDQRTGKERWPSLAPTKTADPDQRGGRDHWDRPSHRENAHANPGK